MVQDLLLITQTGAAYLVRTEDGEDIWIPKSQVINIDFGDNIDDEESGQKVLEIKSMEMTAWIAEEKGLV